MGNFTILNPDDTGCENDGYLFIYAVPESADVNSVYILPKYIASTADCTWSVDGKGRLCVEVSSWRRDREMTGVEINGDSYSFFPEISYPAIDEDFPSYFTIQVDSSETLGALCFDGSVGRLETTSKYLTSIESENTQKMALRMLISNDYLQKNYKTRDLYGSTIYSLPYSFFYYPNIVQYPNIRVYLSGACNADDLINLIQDAPVPILFFDNPFTISSDVGYATVSNLIHYQVPAVTDAIYDIVLSIKPKESRYRYGFKTTTGMSSWFSLNFGKEDVGECSVFAQMYQKIGEEIYHSLNPTYGNPLTVIDYSGIDVYNLTASRLNNVEKTTTITFNCPVPELIYEGTDYNSLKEIKYRYRNVDSSTWSDWSTSGIVKGANDQYTITMDFEIAESYMFEVYVEDEVQSTTESVQILQGKPLFSQSEKGYFVVGGFPDDNYNDCKLQVLDSGAYVKDKVIIGDSTIKGVKNNLTTSSGGEYVLDAYQGKMLNDKITTINSNLTKFIDNTQVIVVEQTLSMSAFSTAGFVTGGSKNVQFTIPLCYTIDANVSSVSFSELKCTFRQSNKYCYGSSASASVECKSYASATLTPFGIQIILAMPNTTNVTSNNDTMGVYISYGTMTFA